MSEARFSAPPPALAAEIYRQGFDRLHDPGNWIEIRQGGFNAVSGYQGWELHCQRCGLGAQITLPPDGPPRSLGRLQRQECAAPNRRAER